LADACRELDAEYLPPAAQGDVYRAALERPDAIGLIDGYFHRLPAVWHKEILWAMAQGIRVYGAASMGALRAAELADFGMHGTGWVFEAYRSGLLEDDDEVAVAHAPEAYAFRPASEAMVNIRRTLQRARDEQILDEPNAALLCRIAKDLFYADRSYERMLLEAKGRVDPARLELLRAWLARGAVNQKQQDAIAMLRCMRQADKTAAVGAASFTFEHTAAWEIARGSKQNEHTADRRKPVDSGEQDDALLAELRLAGVYPQTCREAVSRALALELARRDELGMEKTALHESISQFRSERELVSDDQFEQWLEAHEVVNLDFFNDESLVRWVRSLFQREGLRVLADQLRASGEYARFAARARDKERVLQSVPREAPGCEPAALITWFCREHLKVAAPAEPQRFAEQLARAWGIQSSSELIEALRSEYLYMRAQGSRQEPP
jgi:hypothetical protein